MDWLEEVRQKAKRNNQVLFTQQNDLIRQIQQLVDGQNHRTVALWAIELADETAQALGRKYPGEERPQRAVELARAWAAGEVKMPLAQRAILDAHAFAKDITSPEDIALCHAVGQACGVVHTVGHAVGYPVYDLTALVRRLGVEGCREAVEQRVAVYFEKMRHWQTHHATQTQWADFMLKD